MISVRLVTIMSLLIILPFTIENTLATTEQQSSLTKQAALDAAGNEGYPASSDCGIASTDCAYEEFLAKAMKSTAIVEMTNENIPAQQQLDFLNEVDLVLGGGDFFQASGNDYMSEGEAYLTLAAADLYATIYSWTYHHQREEWSEAINEANNSIGHIGDAVTAFSNAIADFATANSYYYSAYTTLNDWENNI